MRSIQGWIFALSLAFTNAASAAVISVVGLQDTSNISTNSAMATGSSSGTGEGLLLAFHLGERTSIETGALQFTRKWTDTTSGNNDTLSGQIIEVPLVFQLHLVHWFSLGVGGYYSTNSGNLTESGTVTNSSLGYGSYGIAGTDYGLVGSAALHFYLGHGIMLRLEERYTQGTPNLALTSGAQFHNRDLQTLAGLSFILGSYSRGPH